MTLRRNKPRQRKRRKRHESNVGLLSNPPGRHNPISRLRHDIAHPQRCLLPLSFQRTEPSRRSVFPILNGACFHNAQSGSPLRVTLTELGHKQPPTPLRKDNSTAFGILNETIKQKRSKAMDMRYHWLTDRVRQKQFDVYWRPGRENLGDFHTKHHSAQHHKDLCHLILHEANSLQVLLLKLRHHWSSRVCRLLRLAERVNFPACVIYNRRRFCRR
jgi:hypothetical protein